MLGRQDSITFLIFEDKGRLRAKLMKSVALVLHFHTIVMVCFCKANLVMLNSLLSQVHEEMRYIDLKLLL